jgi:hypothetical protein
MNVTDPIRKVSVVSTGEVPSCCRRPVTRPGRSPCSSAGRAPTQASA